MSNSLLERLGFSRPAPHPPGPRLRDPSSTDLSRLACAACRADGARLEEWRIQGGEFPRRFCVAEHRPLCTRCGDERTERQSGVCDSCVKIVREEKRAAKLAKIRKVAA